MSKRAILRFTGDLNRGLSITLEAQENQTTFTEASGSLPPSPNIIHALEQWQNHYRQWIMSHSAEEGGAAGRLSSIRVTVQPDPQSIRQACCRWGKTLQKEMEQWLADPGFRPIDQRLREVLISRNEEAQLLLRFSDRQLHRLPWQTWEFVERYPGTEVIFASSAERLHLQQAPSDRVRVLAILGGHDGELDTNADLAQLQRLTGAEVCLVTPSRREINNQLWDQHWDILFFAGHSSSDEETGYLSLSPTERLTLEELRYGLQRAINQGLQLAIFNSCDGLGLAYALETLYLPQLVLMREPVPDPVAQQFLSHFLTAFSGGASLHLSLRQARERLQGLENQFPFATWLPVLFQNPAVKPPTWQSLQGKNSTELPELLPKELDPVPNTASAAPTTVNPSWGHRSWTVSLGLTFLVMALRYAGLFQSVELGLYDFLLRSRPAERRDDRIVIINVTEDYVRKQPAELSRQASLNDQALDNLLTTINALNPQTIGLDIYRDEPASLPSLRRQFEANPKLLGICKGEDPSSNAQGIEPPPGMPMERVGFSDLRSDKNEIVRTQLLSARTFDSPPCLDFSLSAAVAEHYLNKKGIPLDSTHLTWRWGNVKFPDLGASLISWPRRFFHYGPYAGVNASGYQLLLNYRSTLNRSHASPLEAFQHFSIEEVLNNQLTARDVEGKIVLIGVSAESITQPDLWPTPYRTFDNHLLIVPGVTLQAQMASQIISAVLDGRKLLWALPFWVEVLGIGGGAIAVTYGLSKLRSRWQKGIFVGTAGLGLGAIAWGSFVLIGLYVPFLPAVLTLSGIGLLNGTTERADRHP